MGNSKMCIRVRTGAGLGKVGPFAKHVSCQLLSKGGISGLGEQRLLFKDSKESHWFLKHVDARLKIHTKVNISPVKTFPDIFLLLQSEHVLVEELLKFLIDIVDTDLLKTIVVKNLKASNIGDLLHRGGHKSLITLLHHNSEGSLID